MARETDTPLAGPAASLAPRAGRAAPGHGRPLIALALAAAALAPAAARADAPAADAGADTIVVTAQKINATHVSDGGSLGVLGQTSALKSPFSIKSYDATLILNQQPETLGAVLDNDPSVRTTYAFGTAAEQFVIRGFPLFGDDIAIDGLYGLTPRQIVAPELYDQVQVLNGASAFLFGAPTGGSGLGGTVNLMPKRAGDTALTRATVNYSSRSTFGGAFDVARRFGDANEFGIRINGAGHWGEDGIHGEHRDSQVLGIGADYRHEGLRISFDLAYQRYKVDHMRPMVIDQGGIVPTPPPSAVNYGANWATSTLRDIFGIARIEYDILPGVTVYATGGGKDGNESGLYQDFYLTNAQTGAAWDWGEDTNFLSRNSAEQAGLRAKLTTGPISHAINLGISLTQENQRQAYAFSAYGASPANSTNIYRPVALATPAFDQYPSGDLADPYLAHRYRFVSYWLSDTLGALDDRILVTAGFRHQKIKDTEFTDYGVYALSSIYDAGKTSPVVGVIVRPTSRISFYFNRIEGFQLGPTAPVVANYTNAGASFPPFTSVQYETGAKAALGRFTASAAWYTITEPNAATAQGGGNTFAINGTQKNTGVELSLQGEIAHGLRLISGATWADAKLHGTYYGALDGHRGVGVPRFTANADVEWDVAFLPGITLTGRELHTSGEYADQANTLHIPTWDRVDLGARYVFAADGKPVTLRFNVDNVANRSYWASGFGAFSYVNQLVQGLPRTFKASATIDF